MLRSLLDAHPVDVLFSVQEAADRLQHVYYRYMDPADPMSRSRDASDIRAAVDRCFAATDRIVGLLEEWAGDDGSVLVCSDHGFTAWETTVHLNTLLAGWGYLKLRPVAAAMQTPAARRTVAAAKRFLPRKMAGDLKSKTFGVIDWSKTGAFASPIPQQGVFVNLEGREPFGIVPVAHLEAVKSDLVERFQRLIGPDDAAATDVVWRSEEVFDGPAIDGAPDVLPVMRDHRFELDDEVFHDEVFSDVRHLPRGVHHPDGIVVVAGAGVNSGAALQASVMDVLPTLLYQAGLKVPQELDGAVIETAFTRQHRGANPIETMAPLPSAASEETSPYSREEEALIEQSLRDLGYL